MSLSSEARERLTRMLTKERDHCLRTAEDFRRRSVSLEREAIALSYENDAAALEEALRLLETPEPGECTCRSENKNGMATLFIDRECPIHKDCELTRLVFQGNTLSAPLSPEGHPHQDALDDEGLREALHDYRLAIEGGDPESCEEAESDVFTEVNRLLDASGQPLVPAPDVARLREAAQEMVEDYDDAVTAMGHRPETWNDPWLGEHVAALRASLNTESTP